MIASRNRAISASRETLVGAPINATAPAVPAITLRRIEAFLETLAAERGAARLTLSAYRGDLEDLAFFLAARRGALETADTAGFRGYVGGVKAHSLAPRAVGKRGSTIRAGFLLF